MDLDSILRLISELRRHHGELEGVEEIEGETLVAVEVPEVAYDLKPCYHRPHHLQEGSFIRVGNSTRRMSDYEIYSFISSRTQPTFDEEPVLRATMQDLDKAKLEKYIARRKEGRPNAPYWNLPFEQILKQQQIVVEVDGIQQIVDCRPCVVHGPSTRARQSFAAHLWPGRAVPQVSSSLAKYRLSLRFPVALSQPAGKSNRKKGFVVDSSPERIVISIDSHSNSIVPGGLGVRS